MYDLAVLGGGPAGYNAAVRAAENGMSVVLFEGENLGGTCLNRGCIPSKTLLHSAKIYDYANGGGAKYGVSCAEAKLDFPAVMKRKDKVVRLLVAGVAAQLKAAGVEVLGESAVIEAKGSDGFRLSSPSGGVTAKNVLIATGASAIVPPIAGLQEALDAGSAITERGIFALDSVPESLAVIGGGVAGLEIASIFSSFGSRVTVIEMLDRIGGRLDRDIAENLYKNLVKKGINFELGAKVTRAENGRITYELAGEKKTLEAEKTLISAGRKPNSAGTGFAGLGGAMDGASIITDENMRTSIPGIYAAGDVNGKYMLAHTAYREGEAAVADMLGQNAPVNYAAIPSVIYTNPEVACVGETLSGATFSSATPKGMEMKETVIPCRMSGRYMAENEGGDGFCKLVTRGNRVVGFHMVGNLASEAIMPAVMAIEAGMGLDEIKRFVFPHPSVTELFREAAFMAEK